MRVLTALAVDIATTTAVN